MPCAELELRRSAYAAGNSCSIRTRPSARAMTPPNIPSTPNRTCRSRRRDGCPRWPSSRSAATRYPRAV